MYFKFYTPNGTVIIYYISSKVERPDKTIKYLTSRKHGGYENILILD